MGSMPRHRIATVIAAIAVVGVALPVLAGALPGGAPGPGAPAASPDASEKPGRGPKADKAPSTPVTLTGRIGTRTDEDGRPEYTLTVGGTTYVLHAGPPWWWGDAHPLAAKVGDTVTIEGDRTDGTQDVDVRTVDGTAIREPGRPPWAGGWKSVGERHPGWSADKEAKREWQADRKPGPPPWARPNASPTPAP